MRRVPKKWKDPMLKVLINVALIHVLPGYPQKVVFLTVQNKGHFQDLLCIFDFFFATADYLSVKMSR